MQCSGLQIFSFLVLLTGTVAVVVSICTRSWFITRPIDVAVTVPGTSIGASAGVEVERGLWYECQREWVGDSSISHEQCGNRFDQLTEQLIQERHGQASNSNKISDVQVWEMVVLGLMCGSALLGLVSLLFSPCCCNRCGCGLASAVFFAAALSASGLCTYAYYAMTNHFNDNQLQIGEISKHFGWSYWCGVAGGACQFFSGILFAVSRCRQHSYSHTV